MKIAVISDTHILSPDEKMPKQMISELKNFDMILHAGDLVDLSVLNELNKIKKTFAVSGNMDPINIRKVLPEKQIIQVKDFRIGLTHGGGSPARIIDHVKNVFAADKVDAIVFGHTHKPFNEVIDGILFFNPGSLMDKVFCHENSYGILEINGEIKGRVIKI